MLSQSVLLKGAGQGRRFFSTQKNFKVLVAGGGAGGISVAARLSKTLGPGMVAVIEPSQKHCFQPMWTLVGGGMKTVEQTRKATSEVMPKDATWLKSGVAEFSPESNSVTLEDGTSVKYDKLVVALGLEMKMDKVKGLREALEDSKSNVCSNYLENSCTKTFDLLSKFQKGDALFTQPPMPIKCPGAPQKIAYIADECFERNQIRSYARIHFHSALPNIFAVPKYRTSLEEVVKRKNINTHFESNLVEVRENTAVFSSLKEETKGELSEAHFDFLHVTPPQGPLEVLAKSSLVDAGGWVDVDKSTLQHKKFDNVFALGDCTNLPTSKTAAAVAEQNEIVANNIMVEGAQAHFKTYNGYTSCPLVTGYKTVILAEFDYDKNPVETFFLDQGQERASMFWLKTEVMPRIYWDWMTTGNWAGPKQYRQLLNPTGSG